MWNYRGKIKCISYQHTKRTLLGEDWYNSISKFTKELSNQIKIKLTEQAHHIGKAIVFKIQSENLSFEVIKSHHEKPTISSESGTFEYFNVGDIIFHNTLGTGTINNVSGSGESTLYDIQFSSGKEINGKIC